MRFLNLIGPYLAAWGDWTYLVIFAMALLESTAFLGLLVPGTTFAIFIGFLASQGLLDLGDVLIVASLGGVTGDTISYFWGKSGKNWFSPDSKIFKEEYLRYGQTFFKNHGDTSIFWGRFVGPLRPVVPFVAGLSGLRLGTFFIFDVMGGIASAFVYTLLGFYFGEAWGRAVHILGRVGLGALILILGVILVGYIFNKLVLRKDKII